MTAQILEASFTAPPVVASGWTDLSAFVTKSDISINGTPGVRISSAVNLSAHKVRGIYRAKPGTNWTIIARIRRHMPMGGANAYGLLLYESATAKGQIFGWTQAGGVGSQRLTGLTSLTNALSGTDNWSGVASGSYTPWDGWLRVVRTGGNYQYSISEDGNFWSLVKSQAYASAGFTTEASHVGIAINTNNNVAPAGVAMTLGLDLFSWLASSP